MSLARVQLVFILFWQFGLKCMGHTLTVPGSRTLSQGGLLIVVAANLAAELVVMTQNVLPVIATTTF